MERGSGLDRYAESLADFQLWFCSLHAIHHFSMIRTIAVHELGLSLPVEFGTAPSTLLCVVQFHRLLNILPFILIPSLAHAD
jgi:hypothetical protein